MKTVMCFGTFDKFHPGHLAYLKQAKTKGDFLIAVVARDKNVLKYKGRLPRQNELQRLLNVKQAKIVNLAVLGYLRDCLRVIKKYRPDVICLGYDQRFNLNKLKKAFGGKIYRLKAYKPHLYKSSKMK